MAQTRYGDLRKARIGALADNGPYDAVSLINASPSAAQVSTITVDTATNDHTYAVVVQGVTVSFTADGSATVAEVAAGLRAAIVADGIAAAGLNVTVAGAVVTLTALYAGAAFTVSTADDKLTIATATASATAAAVPFGALVLHDGASSKYAKQLKTSNLVARTRTITVGGTAENNKNLLGTVTVAGIVYMFTTASGGSATLANTAQALRDAINAALPADTVIAESAAGVVTLTAEVPGVPFGVTCSGVALSTMTLTVGGDAFVANDDVTASLAGLALHELTHEVSAAGEAQYEPNSVMSVLRRGRVNVLTAEQVAPGKDVYVATADGRTFRASAATGFVRLPFPRFRWADAPSSTVGVLELA